MNDSNRQRRYTKPTEVSDNYCDNFKRDGNDSNRLVLNSCSESSNAKARLIIHWLNVMIFRLPIENGEPTSIWISNFFLYKIFDEFNKMLYLNSSNVPENLLHMTTKRELGFDRHKLLSFFRSKKEILLNEGKVNPDILNLYIEVFIKDLFNLNPLNYVQTI